MLSIQATVYTDSNDKYTSIFNVSKRGLSSQFKYSNISIYKCLEFGTRACRGLIIALKFSTDGLQRGRRVSPVRKFA